MNSIRKLPNVRPRNVVVKCRAQDQEVARSIPGKVLISSFLILLCNIDCGLSFSIFISLLFQFSMIYVHHGSCTLRSLDLYDTKGVVNSNAS